MQPVIQYLSSYIKALKPAEFALCSLLTGILIFLNYRLGLEDEISHLSLSYPSFFGHAFLFLFIFVVAYLIVSGFRYFRKPQFVFLILVAPFLFSLKMTMSTEIDLGGDNEAEFWNRIFYWPLRLIVMVSFLAVLWRTTYYSKDFYGLTVKNFNARPYLLMLLIMLPLVFAAALLPDFQATYPKFQNVDPLPAGAPKWFYLLLFELSYGSDFLSIELFFRGFLILGFLRIAGKDAILPMACFYCAIHFGKPLGECISSYFGGIILGIVTWRTGSIVGGLLVHLGIAWMMELFGWWL